MVYSESKPAPDGRPVVHLSFPDGGVNARTAGVGFPIDRDGFATLQKIASAVVGLLARATLRPDLYPPGVLRARILSWVVDGEAAFTRLFLACTSVGKIASLLLGFWIVALSCWFGWEGSSRYFSGVTVATVSFTLLTLPTTQSWAIRWAASP